MSLGWYHSWYFDSAPPINSRASYFLGLWASPVRHTPPGVVVHGRANPQDFKCCEAVHRTSVLLLYVYLLCISGLQRHVKNVSKWMSHKCAGSAHWNALPDSLALSLQTEQTLWLRWPPWMLGSLTSCLWLFYCKKFLFYCKGGKKKSHEQKHAFLLSDGLWGPDIRHREVFAPPGVTW